jgi:uncharacterized membrane protein
MSKAKTIPYWIATALMSVGMLGSGIAQVMHAQQMIDLVKPLGYPVYFLSIIGVWKMLGVIAILLPGFKLVKEWAYAGFFFVMTGALVSHLAVGVHDVKDVLGPVFQTIFIVLSWYCRPDSRKLVAV